ncbi:MAG: IS4 family transposase [Bacteroidota bacterium]|nr:IS4 family transposase [Bacteroidota bacterium]
MLAKDIDAHISSFFSKEELDRLARITGFNKRCEKGKLTGSMFLDLMVFNADKLSDQTLESNCCYIEKKYGVIIKRQSISERFNESSVFFLRTIFEMLLQKRFQFDRIPEDFKKYNRVLIKDSTCFKVPSDLKDKYRGCGSAEKQTEAIVRIQLEYDLLSGCVTDMRIESFTNQDAANSAETIDLIQPGDLIIRDLAYMHKMILQSIDNKKAFYSCRLDPRISVFEYFNGQYQKLNFAQIYEFMKENNISILDKQVCLGNKKDGCTRLIISVLPEELLQQRLLKAYKERKRIRGGEPSKEYKARAKLTLMITNIPDTQLSAEHVQAVYMLRWQIELMFKTWKSVCGLASIKLVKGHRVDCYIHGKLIFILLSWNIIWSMFGFFYKSSKKTISIYKANKVILERSQQLADLLIFKKGKPYQFFEKLFIALTRFCLCEPKKGDQHFIKIIISSFKAESDVISMAYDY